jgi:thiamine pyrophosphokinase
MRAVIFANGVLNDHQTTRKNLRAGDWLIAADGGTENCLALGLQPTTVIGDLDSLSDDRREELEKQGTHFLVHPRDKDQTDLELALTLAVQEGAEEILLIGLLGGRLDQTLANLLLLARPEWQTARLVVSDGLDSAYLLHPDQPLILSGEPGEVVSLIPLTPVVEEVSTSGLRWALNDTRLSFGSTLGVSNEMTSTSCQVTFRKGVLLVVHRCNSGASLEGV